MTTKFTLLSAPMALAVAVSACSEPSAPDVKEDPVEAIEFTLEEPVGDGSILDTSGQKSVVSQGHLQPAIAIGEGWSEAQTVTLSQLRDEAIAKLTDPAFQTRAERLRQQHSKVWFSEPLGFKDSAAVGQFVSQPAPPVSYTQASILPSRKGAVTRVEDGRLVIRLNPDLLERWQSADPVERGCAVNTMAHEITHTLTRRTDGFYYAFTDTGVGREARATAPASYVAGNLALCSYLVDQGQIAEDDVGKCMKVWYRRKGFQSGQCTAFADGSPVEWR